MRWCLVAVVALGCGEVHFLDPNPPRLFRANARFTSAARDEPVVWLAIVDLFLEDAAACPWARSTTISTIRAAIAAAGGSQLELPAQDLAPDCRARGSQPLDATAIRDALAVAQSAFSGAHVRPVIVYADNVDLQPPVAVLNAVSSLRTLSSPPAILWTIARPRTSDQLGPDRAIEWTYAGDPALGSRLAATVEAFLPLRTTASASSGPVPLLDAAQLETTREFKVCAVPNVTAAQDPPPVGLTQIVDRANPPTITFEIPQSFAMPKSLFSDTTLVIPVEGCLANCERYFIEKAGDAPQRWDEMRRCALGTNG